MAERRFIQPPELVETDGRIIFLAGPVQGAPEAWQLEMATMIHDIDSTVTVASPRKDYEPGTFVYEKQVAWETEFLHRAGKTGVIAFWLANQSSETPGRSYGQTTRAEWGTWFTRHYFTGAKMVMGGEGNFGNEKYFAWHRDHFAPELPILNSKEEFAQTAVEMLDQPRTDRETLIARFLREIS